MDGDSGGRRKHEAQLVVPKLVGWTVLEQGVQKK